LLLDIKELTKNFETLFYKIFSNSINEVKFDKDNDDHVLLLTTIANMRCYNFQIPMTTSKKAREVVGNIVPAISSTNSLVSGYLVHSIFKFLVKKHLY